MDKYKTLVDRESAFEKLKAEKSKKIKTHTGKESRSKKTPKKSNRQTPAEAFFKSLLRTVGVYLGKHIVRGIMGTLKPK